MKERVRDKTLFHEKVQHTSNSCSGKVNRKNRDEATFEKITAKELTELLQDTSLDWGSILNPIQVE